MLKFNSLTEQVCYIALPKDKGKETLKNYTVLFDHIVYEHKENLRLQDDEIVLEVVLDISDAFDLTNNENFNSIKNVDNMMSYIQNKKYKLIRFVESGRSAIYRLFYIKYRILDCSAIKNVTVISS